MGERTDDMDMPEMTDGSTQPTPGSAEGDDIQVVREQIEETRAEMSETIDAIEKKLSPEQIKEQAKQTVRDATVGKASRAARTAGDRARQTMATASSQVSPAVSHAGDTVRETVTRGSRTVQQRPVPAAASTAALVALTLAARGLILWRQRATEAQQQRLASRSAAAGQRLQQAAGRIADQARGASSGLAGRSWMSRQGAEAYAQSGAGPATSWPDTVVTVADLAAGLGLALALAILRRSRRTT